MALLPSPRYPCAACFARRPVSHPLGRARMMAHLRYWQSRRDEIAKALARLAITAQFIDGCTEENIKTR